MKRFVQQLARYVGLTALTVAACFVMWWVSQRNEAVQSEGQAGTARPPAAAAEKARVAVADVRPQMCELLLTASGKVRPWETYSLGFEIGGRVLELGVDAQDQPLDDGAAVAAGQVLARLDDRILRARRSEAIAQLEQATSDLRRDRRLRERGGQAITDAEFQDTLTRLAVAKAQNEVVAKNLEDSVLVSPVSGTISRRMVEAGESVGANEMIFEIVENNSVLLVVDVPEARIRELELRRRAVREQIRRGVAASDPSAVFRARVNLEGRDAFGRSWPSIDAEVYRIAQVADARTGLFEVEIRIPNADGLLRPGMVATAQIVTDRLLAYRIPEDAVIFRGRDAYLYHLQSEQAPVKAMFWKVGQTELQRAERVDIERWIDQGDVVLVPASSIDLGPVVTRGQQRLASGQLVRVTNPQAMRQDRVVGPRTGGSATARRLPDPDEVEVN